MVAVSPRALHWRATEAGSKAPSGMTLEPPTRMSNVCWDTAEAKREHTSDGVDG